jgi:hypothetical protein
MSDYINFPDENNNISVTREQAREILGRNIETLYILDEFLNSLTQEQKDLLTYNYDQNFRMFRAESDCFDPWNNECHMTKAAARKLGDSASEQFVNTLTLEQVRVLLPEQNIQMRGPDGQPLEQWLKEQH